MEHALFIGFGLIAGGLLLVVAELFIPSHGLLSLAAGAVAIAGVVVLFLEDPGWGVIGLLLIAVLGPMSFALGLRIWPDTPIGRRMLHGEGGAEAEAQRHVAAERERDQRLALIGKEGRALTDLHPVGIIELDGRRMDAIAELGIVASGSVVRVTSTEHNQIRVRAV